MRAAAAFALTMLACSANAPPGPAPGSNPQAPAIQLAQPAASHACAACGASYEIVKIATAPYRAVRPELDSGDLARRLNRTDLTPALDDLIATVETKIASATSDAQAGVALDAFVFDLERLAKTAPRL